MGPASCEVVGAAFRVLLATAFSLSASEWPILHCKFREGRRKDVLVVARWAEGGGGWAEYKVGVRKLRHSDACAGVA